MLEVYKGRRRRLRPASGHARHVPHGLVLAVALAAGCEGGQSAGEGLHGVRRETPAAGTGFSLTDMYGEPFDFRAETDGFVTLLFFGYTHCPDICPVHMANLAAVLDDLPLRVRRQVKVVFVTTDPARDTPARLRAWLGRIDPSFIGLRGTPREIRTVQVGLGLPPAVVRPGPSPDYRVDHAAQVIAFGADKEFRLDYPFGVRQVDWAHDLPLLVESSVAGVPAARAGSSAGS